jgi:hypothetical protein
MALFVDGISYLNSATKKKKTSDVVNILFLRDLIEDMFSLKIEPSGNMVVSQNNLMVAQALAANQDTKRKNKVGRMKMVEDKPLFESISEIKSKGISISSESIEQIFQSALTLNLSTTKLNPVTLMFYRCEVSENVYETPSDTRTIVHSSIYESKTSSHTVFHQDGASVDPIITLRGLQMAPSRQVIGAPRDSVSEISKAASNLQYNISWQAVSVAVFSNIIDQAESSPVTPFFEYSPQSEWQMTLGRHTMHPGRLVMSSISVMHSILMSPGRDASRFHLTSLTPPTCGYPVADSLPVYQNASVHGLLRTITSEVQGLSVTVHRSDVNRL